MSGDKITLGRSGEEVAVNYLQIKGLSIEQRNFRCRLGELDIVARDGPFLVFIEVRTVTGNSFGTAQESIDKKKVHKIRLIATYYLQSRNIKNTPLRFDVIAVTMDTDKTIKKLDHIINAF